MKKGVKQDTPIQSIRKQYVAGVYSFAKFVNHFEPLSKYVDDNEKEVLPFLTTPSRTPPKEFQAIAEQCLRSVGRLKNSPFGQACMSTASAWNKVEPYKKAWMWEAWLSTVLKLESQNPWTKADWARVQLRRAVHRVFTKHILSVSDSMACVRFPGKVIDPPNWEQEQTPKKSKQMRRSTRKTQSNSSHSDLGTSSQPIELWDSDDDASTPPATPSKKRQRNSKGKEGASRSKGSDSETVDEDCDVPSKKQQRVLRNRKKGASRSKSTPSKSTPRPSPKTPSRSKKNAKKNGSPCWRERRGTNRARLVSRSNIYVGIFSAPKTNSFDSQARHICSISC